MGTQRPRSNFTAFGRLKRKKSRKANVVGASHRNRDGTQKDAPKSPVAVVSRNPGKSAFLPPRTSDVLRSAELKQSSASQDPLREEAFHGLPGEIVRTIGPHKAAVPVAPSPEEGELRSDWGRFVFDPGSFIPPEQPIYEGILAMGDLAVWLGREKHRKSNTLLQFAICAALGRNFLHFHFAAPRAVKVVTLDYESKSQTLKQRYAAIVAAMGLDESEQQTLQANLRIVEMRKAFRQGQEFARFPVKLDRKKREEPTPAEKAWRCFLQEMSADLYIIDPMRCMHAQAENDSFIETLLTCVHQFFGESAVVISHHLRKRNRKKSEQPTLREDMRVWADEARGSGAITAHADVIICQERVVEHELERLDLGAYLRDGADIEPIALRESEPQSFFWQVAPDVPGRLVECLNALHAAGGQFLNRAAAVAVLEQRAAVGRSTAYNRVEEMLNRGLLKRDNGLLKVGDLVELPARPQCARLI